MKVHNKATEEFRPPTSLFELDQYKPLSFLDYKMEQYGVAGLGGIIMGLLVGAPLAIAGGIGVGASLHRSFWENKKINHENKMESLSVQEEVETSRIIRKLIEADIDNLNKLHVSKIKTMEIGNYILCGIGCSIGVYFLSESAKSWEKSNSLINYSITCLATSVASYLSIQGFSKALQKVDLI
ncbi:MAG: hypothetical protein COT84_05660 [Chlamydiae bacterium CG10_big_fil_rev_8_21_14_0_10_35_9]|nr:MAG: hypothetical protein COT84_05660 [Chlamydiae bacterium CG10_big_fil_rev_8_21_14_0_10_35_9]